MESNDIAMIAHLSASLQVHSLVPHWLGTHSVDPTGLPVCFDTNGVEACAALLAHEIFPHKGLGFIPCFHSLKRTTQH